MERDNEKEAIEWASKEKTTVKKVMLENPRAKGHFKNRDFENISIQDGGRWKRIEKKMKQDKDYFK